LDPDPDSLEMLDPDPDLDSMNPDPQLFMIKTRERCRTVPEDQTLWSEAAPFQGSSPPLSDPALVHCVQKMNMQVQLKLQIWTKFAFQKFFFNI
jgi:hypothetical protein